MPIKRVAFVLSTSVIIAVIALIAGAAGVLTQFQPVSQTTTMMQQFVVPKGQAISIIANRLHEAGLIRQPWAFRLELKRLGSEGKLQAGSFELSPDMSLGQIIQTMTTGTTDIWITIPEGWRREELADSLAGQELPEFDKAEFLELTAGREGQLFPDTYLVPRQADATQIAGLLEQTFTDKVELGLAEEIQASSYSFADALIMASLVERESSGADEMPEVAGILWNRIEIGMPLQVDATLQYAKGYHVTSQSWWVPPLAADKELNSPFNTYLNPGLPPQPIASPGIDAIKAALAPAVTSDLFYIHDSEGMIHMAETLDQHNANIDRYLR